MLGYFEKLYQATDFMPHGDCFLWNTILLWQHVGSDIATGIAYYVMGTVLLYFIFKRRDIPFFWIFILFGAFFFSCGTTHLMAAWTTYFPSYWVEGIIKIVNSIISLGTAIILLPMMPKLLALPNLKKAYGEIEELNITLNKQVIALTKENRKRKAAENQLQDSHRLLHAIVEGTTDSIFLKDLQGCYILANDATLLALGKSESEVIGKDDSLLFPSGSATIIGEVDASVIESGKSLLVEEKMETAHGNTLWLSNKTPYRDKDGSIIGLIGISRNITKLKKAEEEQKEMEAHLQQAYKIEALGTLAGGIAHDFNNLLMVIIGFADLAKADADPNSMLTDNLEKVIGAGHRAIDLVKQILTFSRQEKVERIPLQLQSLVKEALKMLRSSIPTSIEIQDRIDSNCGVVLADPTQVHQILMNLCSNANHAMEGFSGVLKVELKSIVIEEGKQQWALKIEPGEYVELTVSDTGPGIDPEVIDKIFDPYFTTKERGKGTGMGLAIIHAIIAEYGGTITVESEFGKGSTFHVCFKVVEEQELQQSEAAEEIPRGNERILFIDDEAPVVELGKNMLERLGYSVTSQQSSVEALSVFQNSPDAFDIIITDQTMPDMTGSELARNVLQIRSDIPIILCTGYSNIVDEESAKSIGIREFALKPLTKNGIAKLIRKVLDES